MKLFTMLLCAAMLFSGCSKEPPGITVSAEIQLMKYPCGPACDAADYVIFPDNETGVFYYPANLPDNFRKDSLRVTITYYKTGQFPGHFEAPAGEIITVMAISR